VRLLSTARTTQDLSAREQRQLAVATRPRQAEAPEVSQARARQQATFGSRPVQPAQEMAAQALSFSA
jgi:hypothetical protein